MQSSFFIVWRESLEALLIIGILYNWLKRENLTRYISSIWIGLGLGLAMSLLLAIVFWFASHWLSSSQGEWFLIFMTGFASILILQMIVWMHHNGRKMKKSLEEQASRTMQSSQRFGLTLLTMLAVAREGSETVIFLAGVGVQQKDQSMLLFTIGALCGLLFALLTFFILQKFTNIFSLRWFFIFSEYALLLIGGGLLMTACDKLISQLLNYDLPDWAYDLLDTPLWDSSWLIKDNSTLTGLTGYHAMPSFMEILFLVVYWGLALYFMYCYKSYRRQKL